MIQFHIFCISGNAEELMVDLLKGVLNYGEYVIIMCYIDVQNDHIYLLWIVLIVITIIGIVMMWLD